jgi:aryl-alcohol dehydrogenase-like predicted oxidoreductase
LTTFQNNKTFLSFLPILKLIFGTWNLSHTDWSVKLPDPGDFRNLLSALLESGITTIDTAPIYGLGEVESFLGGFDLKSFKLSTKFGLEWTTPYNARKMKISLRSPLSEIQASIKRLKIESIGYYFLHYPPHTINSKDLHQCVHDIEALRVKGFIQNFGLSNAKPIEHHDLFQYFKPRALQLEHNLLQRWAEEKVIPHLKPNCEIWGYSPLARGFLSGKYHSSSTSPKDHRQKLKYFKNYQQSKPAMEQYAEIAEELNLTPAGISMAWLASRWSEHRILIAPRTVSQLHDLIRGYQTQLSSESLSLIENLF